MARIRSIKPEFFTSDDIVRLSPSARLLYIAIWCEADREGRLEWRPSELKRRYVPDDTDAIAALCDELTGSGLVVLYGDGLAWIPTFLKHQIINPREAKSQLPAPPEKEEPDACMHASLRVHVAPSLPFLNRSVPVPVPPEPSAPTLRPLVAKRNLRSAYEHPRFDVPDWWHLEHVKGLPGGEAEMARFYRDLAAHVEAHPQERTLPRKEWLAEHFRRWLDRTAASTASGFPSAEETRARVAAAKAMVGQ